ncbi:MAG TPA: hypothetical protein DIW44_07995 [Anaerolineaceae bacterium]|nr:hypothetical protein [Anaerolineaceae bacterium]
MINKGLIFIPTYNERENVGRLIDQLDELNFGFDYLFIDDNSPDKTGEFLDQLAIEKPYLFVIHRLKKLGIGSAHIDGIEWAYKHNYQILITMDSDFSHSPTLILELIKNSEIADVVVGSRFAKKNSLSEWNFLRKFLTHLGHLLTKLFFKMPFDATGALRLYRVDKIHSDCFNIGKSKGYSFFFESLYILYKNNYNIIEIAIDLPARTYGQSKMKFKDAVYSLYLLFKMVLQNLFFPSSFLVYQKNLEIQNSVDLIDEQGWDDYWAKQHSINNWLYDHIASLFRQIFIKPYLNSFIHKYLPKGSLLLHAGCGSGQVDFDITNNYAVIAMDFSMNALNLYRNNHIRIENLIQNDIRNMDLENESIDGIYSLGVMEHFEKADILLILEEFRRVLKNNGKAIIFWPPAFGLSVYFLKIWHFMMNKILSKNIKLHPPEVSLLRSKKQIIELSRESGFSLIEYRFGPRDLFTQVVIVLNKVDVK